MLCSLGGGGDPQEWMLNSQNPVAMAPKQGFACITQYDWTCLIHKEKRALSLPLTLTDTWLSLPSQHPCCHGSIGRCRLRNLWLSRSLQESEWAHRRGKPIDSHSADRDSWLINNASLTDLHLWQQGVGERQGDTLTTTVKNDCLQPLLPPPRTPAAAFGSTKEEQSQGEVPGQGSSQFINHDQDGFHRWISIKEHTRRCGAP
ncbi:hypothetical protein MHYP_G00227410 [Metynnis hypsauchen]